MGTGGSKLVEAIDFGKSYSGYEFSYAPEKLNDTIVTNDGEGSEERQV